MPNSGLKTLSLPIKTDSFESEIQNQQQITAVSKAQNSVNKNSGQFWWEFF